MNVYSVVFVLSRRLFPWDIYNFNGDALIPRGNAASDFLVKVPVLLPIHRFATSAKVVSG
jgi:hypothetical protein